MTGDVRSVTIGERLARIAGGLSLFFVALWLPFIGMAASSSEDVKGTKYLGFLESDWFFWFGLVGAGACVWAARQVILGPRSVD